MIAGADIDGDEATLVHVHEGLEGGAFDDALHSYSRGIKLNPKDAAAFYGRANCKAESGDYGAAIADLDEAINLNSKEASYFKQRGNFYYRLSDRDKACFDWRKAVELGDAKARFQLDQYCKR